MKTGCQYVAQAGLKLMILPVLLPEGWDHKLTGTVKEVSSRMSLLREPLGVAGQAGFIRPVGTISAVYSSLRVPKGFCLIVGSFYWAGSTLGSKTELLLDL